MVRASAGLSGFLAGAAHGGIGAPEPAARGPDVADGPRSDADRRGHLVIIGGAEDRKDERVLLHRFVELAGRDPELVVVTAASAMQGRMWDVYDGAFRDLGARRLSHLEIASRTQANDPEAVASIDRADGIFLTGGDQQRLMSTIGGTRVARAIFDGFRRRGACIGGTSAGAAAMAAHMVAEGAGKEPPQKGLARMGAGLGLVPGAIIDQHFSQRRRLGRLLSLVAQAPFLLGVGIDEDTALVVKRGRGVEVLGSGAVTIVDGRNMATNFFDVEARDLLELLNVRLHLLPSGARYVLPERTRALPDAERARQIVPVGTVPASLLDVVTILSDV